MSRILGTYKFFITRKTFDDAVKFCSDEKGELAVITSDKEFDAAVAVANAADPGSLSSHEVQI